MVETSWLAGFGDGERLPGSERLPGGGRRIVIPHVGALAVTRLFSALGRAFLAANGEQGA